MPIRHTPIKISLFEFAYLKASSLFEVAVEINSVNLTYPLKPILTRFMQVSASKTATM